MSAPSASQQRTNWPAIATLFAAGIAAAMQFAKIAPVMDAVSAQFNFSLVEAGLSVSVLGIVGIIFAISAGAIVAAIGLQRGILIALFTGAAIAACGALAPNAALFLVSRVAEGFAHLLIVVCAPALMAAYAASKDRPIVLSLWGCFFGLGFAITSALAPLITARFGWRGLLAAHAILLLAIGCANVYTLSHAASTSGFHETRKPLPRLAAFVQAHKDVYASGAPLLTALTFGAYTILFLAVLTFLGRFLLEVQNWSPEGAGSFMSFAALITLVFTLGSGIMVRYSVPMLWGLSLAYAAIAIGGVGVFIVQPQNAALIGFALIMMAGFGMVPGFIFANLPAVAPTPQRATLTYGAIAQFGNVGTFSGTPIFAFLFSKFGWVGGGTLVSAVALTGIALTLSLTRALRAK